MANNPRPAVKDGLKCPQCSKSRFKSFVAVRDHFLALNHPIDCTKCNKEFKDVMPLIDHYQSHDKKKTAPSKSLAKEVTKQKSNLSSVNPKNSQQKTKQKTTPKTTDQAALQTPKVTDLALRSYATVPAPIISAQGPKNGMIQSPISEEEDLT